MTVLGPVLGPVREPSFFTVLRASVCEP